MEASAVVCLPLRPPCPCQPEIPQKIQKQLAKDNVLCARGVMHCARGFLGLVFEFKCNGPGVCCWVIEWVH